MSKTTPVKADSKRDSKGRFGKGNVANPNGRPKRGNTIADILRKIGDEPSTQKPELTNQQLMLEKVYGLAIVGEQWAVNFVADRTVGKPVQT